MFKHFEILNDIECYNMYSEYTPAVNLDYITYMQLRVASPRSNGFTPLDIECQENHQYDKLEPVIVFF